MGIKTLIMILASLGLSATAFADHHEGGEEKKPFSIYGDFATSLQFHDNENSNTAGNHDDFNINLAEINLEKNWSKSKLHLAIGYGTTPGAVNALANSTTVLNIMNAYYHMNTSYGLDFMIGKFTSPVGHESYNHVKNSQFTRSYGFLLAPVFSTGAGVSYGQDMWKAGFIVTNGGDRDTDTTDRNKTMTVTVDVDPMENLALDLRYLTGTEGAAATAVTVLDFSVSYMINEMFDVALNYIDHGQKTGTAAELKATSIAAYINANLGMYGLGLRYEQFDYDGGMNSYNGQVALTAPIGADNSISAITLAAKAEIDQNASVILEYRMESADDNGTFTDKDGAATDSQSTITAGLMYTF